MTDPSSSHDTAADTDVDPAVDKAADAAAVGAVAEASFTRMWQDLLPVGRHGGTGGYRRFAWTGVDSTLREWFASAAEGLGLGMTIDRAGNQWAWWGDPDAAVAAGDPGIVIGSHLDSVPDGGAFDGPLGVVSSLAAVAGLRAAGHEPGRPIGVVNFADEEGARFGIACAGSRIVTGALAPDRAAALTDADGVRLDEALRSAGGDPTALGRDPETLARIGAFVELHVEQGRGLVDLDRPLAVGSSIWPHGRWRADLPGEANHAGTTRLADRRDPMLALASLITEIRLLAERFAVVATCGKVSVQPNGVNAIPSHVTAWLDARGEDPAAVRALVEQVTDLVTSTGGTLREESWTPTTAFSADLSARLAAVLDDAPVLSTGAGHDAGILANAGVPSAMLFVRNPTGVSHSPAEFAEDADCLAGVRGLARVVADLSR